MTTNKDAPVLNTPAESLDAPQRIAALEDLVQTLQAQVRTYTQALDVVSDMVLVKGPASRIAYANKAFRDYYDMTLDDLRELVDAPFNEPDYTQQYIQDDAYVFTTGQSLDIAREPVTRFDGMVRFFHTIKAAIRDEQGVIIQTVGVSRDITDESRAAAALRSSEERFADMVANVPGMVYQFALAPDGQTSFLYVSDSARDVYGLAPEDIQGNASLIMDVVHGDDQNQFRSSIAESAAALTTWDWEGRIALSSGVEKWLQGAARPMRSADGTIIWNGLLMDISARKQAEHERDRLLEEAQHQRRRLDDLLSNVPGIVWEAIGSPDAPQLQFVSAYIEPMLGYTVAEWHATPNFWRAIMHPDDVASAEQATLTALEQGGGNVVQWRWITKAGRALWTETHQHAVLDGQKRVIGLRGVTMDITARKEAEAEQRRLQEQIIRVQEATLAELSTPLIPISDDVVVMPLIGALDPRRMQQVQENLLGGIAQYRAHTVIVDITGVPVVDTQVANSIIQAARTVRLLGARFILTGIRPEVAQTLVGLGVDLSGIVTESTLQRGIAFAFA